METLNCKNCNVTIKETGLKWSNILNAWYCRKCTNTNDLSHRNDVLRHKEYESNPELTLWRDNKPTPNSITQLKEKGNKEMKITLNGVEFVANSEDFTNATKERIFLIGLKT